MLLRLPGSSRVTFTIVLRNPLLLTFQLFGAVVLLNMGPPPADCNASDVTGKLDEVVEPATYACPDESTATPPPRVSPAPPR